MVGIFTRAKQFIAIVTDNKSLLYLGTTVLSLETLKMRSIMKTKKQKKNKKAKENDEELSLKKKINCKRDDKGPVAKN
jgi:hypothetical protein